MNFHHKASSEGDSAEVESGDYVREGWWHLNVKGGRVHDHPDQPGGSWSVASHRLCEPVYTKRTAIQTGGSNILERQRRQIEFLEILADGGNITVNDIPWREMFERLNAIVSDPV